MGGYAWVTLATNDAYSLGALVLAHSLRRVGTKYELAVLITPGVTQTMREKLSAVFSVVMEVNVLDSKDEANLALLARPELGVTFTKLHCWRLIQYEKCVFLDADTLVVRNCDELFEREELSAAPDVGWPDCFNSGVFVYQPSQQTFASITAFAATKGSFDGGDQGLLNMYFSDWAKKDISKHLPFIYNMCSTATYSYLPAFRQFGSDVRIIHFIGITKPWLQYFDTLTGIVQPPMDSAHLQPLLQLWWNIFCEKVHPQLSPVMATSTLAPIWHKFSPMPYESRIPRAPIYIDIQNKSENDICQEPPDFTEFQDPWENYSVQNDPVSYKAEGNETHQYYFTVNNSPPASVLSEQFSCPKSVHQSYYDSSPEHSRDFHYTQQYNEYNSTSHNQHHHCEEQSNQFIDQNEHQHSSFRSKDTSISEVQHNHWQNQYNIENIIPVHNVQSYHSNESQHKQVEYQYIPLSSCYDSSRLVSEETEKQQQSNYECNQHFSSDNKSLSVDVNHEQHIEPYVEHQCNHYQMYKNVNNDQIPQYYEQKNHIPHSNSQTDFRYEEQTSLDSDQKVDHGQGMKNSVAYQNDLSIQQNTEQDRNTTITDERTDTLVSSRPYPDSKPCTDFRNVAPQFDPQIGDDLNSSNAGLAGALAQMTLGEPRSAEQIALEEHMRKQSWEQGHIDYMGRDSFDNIWKKISETLALAPPRLPSPPKEIQKLEETKTDKTEESAISSETAQSNESLDEVDKGIAQATTTRTEEQSLVNNVPMTRVPKLLEKNEEFIETTSIKGSKDIITQEPFTEPKNETVNMSMDSSCTYVLPSHKEVEKLSSSSISEEAPQQAVEPAASSDSIESHSAEEQVAITSTEVKGDTNTVKSYESAVSVRETKQSDVRDEKHEKQLSSSSENLVVNPVPIQVAESVLQVETKVSTLDPQTASKEVPSSLITPAHLTEAENNVKANSSTSTSDFTFDNLNKSSAMPVAALQTSLPVEQVQSQLTKTSQTVVPESKEIEPCPRKIVQSTTEVTSECEASKTSPSSAAPVRPSRIKEIDASLTDVPKVAQEEKSQKRVIKKTVKKVVEKPATEGELTETGDGDSTGKKITKKVVKKIVKKPKTKLEEGLDDGAEDSSSSAAKQKKTVKSVKKSPKSSETPTADATILETPSSSTSDAPNPPKRKLKTTAAKTVTKKSEIEQ